MLGCCGVVVLTQHNVPSGNLEDPPFPLPIQRNLGNGAVTCSFLKKGDTSGYGREHGPSKVLKLPR